MVDHAALTGSELHEWKGAAAASDNTVYVADGAGSGNWEHILTETNSADFDDTVTSYDIEGLGDFAFLRVVVPCVRSGSNDNTWFYFQVGDNGGFTTSSVYYTTYHNNSGFANLHGYSQAYLGFTYTSDPSAEQSITFNIANFNKPYYSLGYSDPTFQNSVNSPVFFIREQKAYTKIRFWHARTMFTGIISVLGIRG